jgi:sulfite oxidase
MLGEQSLNAVICRPSEGEILSAGNIMLEGWAYAGGARKVARVDVSIDGGATWQTAQLMPEDKAWTWRFWEAQVEAQPGAHQIIVRAWDSAANTQPEDARSIWNFKGYMNNAWHKINVQVKDDLTK